MEDCVKDMLSWDRLIGFYSGDYKFDIPFLRTRAVSQGIDFPGINSIYFEDVYSTVKAKFCMSSNRLATAVRTLTGDTQKTNWFGKYWVRGIQGDPKALAYIEDHCLTPDHKVFMANLTWKSLGDLKIGDEIVSFDETLGPGTSGRHYRKGIITSKDFARAPVFAVELSNGEVFKTTERHGWLTTHAISTGGAAYHWLPTSSLRIDKKYSTKLTRLFSQVSQDHSYPSGYLAAMIDGEGGVDARGQVSISQRPGAILNQTKDFLHAESFSLRLVDRLATRGFGKGDCLSLHLRGGLLHRINFLQRIRPQKITNLDISQWGRLERRPGAEVNSVIKIIPDGVQEIVHIGTSTNTLIVDGYPMHNCRKDVQDLKKLYLKVYPFTKHTNRSL
jgi:intein/homing endonuclease